MNKQGSLLSARIDVELKELELIAQRVKEGWSRAAIQNDGYYLDSVALNLHGFYSGLEKIFEKLASTVDGNIPSATNWHQELLEQMSMEIPNIRPAIISVRLKDMLEDYRGFRHVVWNVYTLHLKHEKLKPLVDSIDEVMRLATEELSAFGKFLAEAD